MGSRGPLPDPGTRRRPGRSKTIKLVSAVTSIEPPPWWAEWLVELMGDYSAETIAWWNAWVASPQASRFSSTDWLRLRMLAPLVEAYFKAPTTALMAEIRQNESKLGATAADRARLGWKTEERPADEPDTPEATSSRRRPDPRSTKEK